MKIVVLGDTHIPRRADWLPREIVSSLEEKDFDLIVFTGDLTDEHVLSYLENLGKVAAVRGNMDHLRLPEYLEVKIGELRAGVIHGDQVYPRGDRDQLEDIGIERGVDILFNGHTHSPHIFLGRVLLLNPGSATGAWGGGGGSMKPSFMVVQIEGRDVDVKLYEVSGSQLNLSREEKFKL
jgi:hypothetical protein